MYRTSHILHVPNTSDRTTVYRVDTDLNFISGPPSLSVTGGDIADYPIMVEPLVRGKFSGAVVFEVVSRSGRIRYIYTCINQQPYNVSIY